MLKIDASKGDGGGQIVRSALALGLATRTPFLLEKIRAAKKKPGLLPQHVVAAQAAAAIGQGKVEFATEGSTKLRFTPNGIIGGSHRFDAGATGSAVLVAQTLLPALLSATGPSEIVVEGNTHMLAAPSYDFFAESYLSALRKMGGQVRAEMWRPGFGPNGAGALRLFVTPGPLGRREFLERGRVVARRALVRMSQRPRSLAERELAVLERRLNWSKPAFNIDDTKAFGTGNSIEVSIRYEHVTEVQSAIVENSDIPVEVPAGAVADAIDLHLAGAAVINERLADQLLVPMALGGGGVLRTVEPSRHTRSQLGLLAVFLPQAQITVEPEAAGTFLIRIGAG